MPQNVELNVLAEGNKADSIGEGPCEKQVVISQEKAKRACGTGLEGI